MYLKGDMRMELLQGKTAIVTGGTRGIGYSIVTRFLDSGANVALCGSRQETVDAAMKKLKESGADMDRIMGICPQLWDVDSVGENFKKVVERFGRIDILVNNAGISAMDRIYDYKYEDYKQVMELNVDSIFVCTQAAARVMREQGGGVIINTSSMVSIYGQPAGVAYPASKAAVNNMTMSLARELGPDNIRVCGVAPGITNTDMMQNVPKEMIEPLIKQVPLRRIGEPDEVADAFVFLASDMASYITGTTLSVDGAARC